MGCSKGGCASGCSRLGVTDWLENMLPPGTTEAENIYEVRFKTTRKAFFRNVNNLEILTGDCVAVESDRGFDIGQVTMGGELARLQMRKKRISEDEILKIYRVATEEDLQLLENSRSREYGVLLRTREHVARMALRMKITDVEFQGDGTKALFFYTADKRVDFRQLIKTLAQEFRVRIEMRQIGMRQEAGVIGGIGSCGRELCCSTFLSSFKSVNTSAARYQNLSLNPTKITGVCGRLKCCLNYELDSYLDALKFIPKVDRLETVHGTAYLQKTDIFRGIMWFSYSGETTWVPLSAQQVKELQEQNKQGLKAEHIGDHKFEVPTLSESALKEPDFVDVVGQSTLHEQKLPGSRRKKNRKPKTLVTGKSEPQKKDQSTREPKKYPDSTNRPTGEGRGKRRGRGGRKPGGNPIKPE